MTRSESKQAMLSELGAVPLVADALDREQAAEAAKRRRDAGARHRHAAAQTGFEQ